MRKLNSGFGLNETLRSETKTFGSQSETSRPDWYQTETNVSFHTDEIETFEIAFRDRDVKSKTYP